MTADAQLRALAAAARAFAETLEAELEGAAENDVAPAPATTKARRRRPIRTPPPLDVEPSELDRARAAAVLRRLGMTRKT